VIGLPSALFVVSGSLAHLAWHAGRSRGYGEWVPKSARKVEFEALYARYRALPEGTKAEIVAGEIRMLPRPRPRHVRATSILGARLVRRFGWDADDGPGGWVILHEPELRLGEEVRAPDLAGWRVERYEEPEDNPITLVPDWICEVLSPTTARIDRVEKMPLYVEHGVDHLWIIDPVMKTLEVYRREGGLWIVCSSHGADDVASPESFDAVPFELGALWRLPEKPGPPSAP
jgi:Uma2 family endonuclease